MMAYNGVIFVPSVDAVQEFKIQTNSFTAQYGLTDGNAVTVITKSGTDKFHGDVFEFFRNYALDANYYFNKDNGLATPSARPSTRMNQFGATAGGPLYIPGIYKQRERTFIFGAYEGLRLDSSSTLKATTPTTAMESGNLSSLLGAQLGRMHFVAQSMRDRSTIRSPPGQSFLLALPPAAQPDKRSRFATQLQTTISPACWTRLPKPWRHISRPQPTPTPQITSTEM
jgi:hypothetical protein